jgi:hypothetical protein
MRGFMRVDRAKSETINASIMRTNTSRKTASIKVYAMTAYKNQKNVN